MARILSRLTRQATGIEPPQPESGPTTWWELGYPIASVPLPAQMVAVSRALRLVPVAVMVLGLAACANDDSEVGGGTPEPSVAGTTAAPSDATSTAPETPPVVPATGKQLSVETVSMRLTDSPDWTMSKTTTTVVANLSLAGGGLIGVTVQDSLTLPGDDTDSAAMSFERTLSKEAPAPTRVANRVVDGVDCFVLEGRNGQRHYYVVGAVVKDRLFLLRFRVPAGFAEGDQMIEQMLVSVDVKGA